MSINELRSILSEHFVWHKSRLDCLCYLLVGLVSLRTVNLSQLSAVLCKGIKRESAYRRLQRFFREIEFDADSLASYAMRCFATEDKYYLSLDRTQWSFGLSEINILVLALVYKRIAIPIYWQLLPHRGNSDLPTRKLLLQKFIDKFGTSGINGLLADREFIGNDWFKWLTANNIAYYIRVRTNGASTNSRGLEIDICGLFYGLRSGEARPLSGKRRLWKQSGLSCRNTNT